jgi:enterochelin esterase-like enzyme
MRRLTPLLALLSLSLLSPLMRTVPASAQTPPTPETMVAELAKPNATLALADTLRSWFGANNLKNGPNPKISDLTAVWAIEVSGASGEPKVVSRDGSFSLPLRRIAGTDVYAAGITLPQGEAFEWAYEVNGKRLAPPPPQGNNRNAPQEWRQLEVYAMPPESKVQPGVPQGQVTQMPPFKSRIFAGTSRDWWVYVPKQYTPDKPACVMVFQDGGGAKNSFPVMFDNLIAKGEIPVMIGIFLQPGTFEGGRSNRSVEYDTLSDKYARFLLEEILPEVEKTYKLRQDAAGRGIAGFSSGGICAFTVAWEKPDAFSKVISGVGSFTNLQGGENGISGGHNYPAMIRRQRGWDRQGAPKPIRIYLSDGANDIDNAAGSWPLANLQMDKALAYGGYDYKFVFGKGFHNNKFGTFLMPDALRWVWRDVK